MAFKFNWSPLTADASFYIRAQELLTTALNKSAKPPIIVDDILVNELNLGSIPPDLEILEVGDLAEDRFRGIFKMCYTGDAFLTLKTRVQASRANPLNTYLSMKPSFASPQPLAAASSLTIPLQITLSDIKLSAIIILVFSKQKGLTLVFRNDPLESLKVSSTFDSIPFVRDYLQKEIEGQLRTLLMDDVPAIIHRLSLRLWVPEYGEKEDRERVRQGDASLNPEKAIDPLANPPQDAVDSMGNTIDMSRVASISLDSGAGTHSLFSQNNLLRLAALTDSHRTLSLFTPSMRDTVFRAWAGPVERGEGLAGHSVMPAMTRTHSHSGSTSTTYVFSDNVDPGARPTLSRFGSAATGLNLAAGRQARPHVGRKRKHRVVNLRKKAIGTDDLESVSAESTYTGTTSSAASDSGVPIPAPEEELVTPPDSPPRAIRFEESEAKIHETLTRSQTIRPSRIHRENISSDTFRPPETMCTKVPLPPTESKLEPLTNHALLPTPETHYAEQAPREKLSLNPSPSTCALPSHTPESPYPYLESSPGGILEQAWMMKIAGEVARRVQEGESADRGFWDRNDPDDTPPPAYGP